MKQPEDNRTAELPLKRGRGRPPAAAVAMTPAQRQKAYRERLKDERYTGKLIDKSRVTLISDLAACLNQLDKDAHDVDLREGAAYLAEDLLAEIVTRYDLNIVRIKRLKRGPGR